MLNVEFCLEENVQELLLINVIVKGKVKVNSGADNFEKHENISFRVRIKLLVSAERSLLENFSPDK